MLASNALALKLASEAMGATPDPVTERVNAQLRALPELQQQLLEMMGYNREDAIASGSFLDAPDPSEPWQRLLDMDVQELTEQQLQELQEGLHRYLLDNEDGIRYIQNELIPRYNGHSSYDRKLRKALACELQLCRNDHFGVCQKLVAVRKALGEHCVKS